MVLAAHSDVEYLNISNVHSHAGAHIMLVEDNPIPPFNGPILIIANIIKFVMFSAVKAKLVGLFITAKEMVPLCHTLVKIG